jgi:glycosyltransferase involved in cell wall biosynthesis
MKKKILIVTSLFTGKSLGGTDRHTLELAKILSIQYEITIGTTNSSDYITWRGDLQDGEFQFENIKVQRFKAEKQRNIKKFNRFYTSLLKKNNLTKEDCSNFINQQGPIVNNLVKYIQSNILNYDIFLFIGYMYFPTIYSLPLVKEKSILIPALHDEPVAYFPIYKEILTDDIIYAFNTIDELALFNKIFNFIPKKNNVIGINISRVNELENENRFKSIDFKFILYIGRIDNGKGIPELINFFKHWKFKNNSDIKLILSGKGDSSISTDDDIIITGYITETEKEYLIQKSILLINPSSLESFSLLLMEAWKFEKAVIVNSKSEILKNHCIRSNAGLYYSDLESFEKVINLVINDNELLVKLGENGKKYISMNYSSEIILNKFNQLFTSYIFQVPI